MRILNLFNLSNAAIIGCLMWQMMDPVKYHSTSGKAWIQNHPWAMFTMCIANFTRVCAYWLFVYQYLKVAWLLPELIDIQKNESSS